MKKPSKPSRLLTLELDKSQGLLDDEGKQELAKLEAAYDESIDRYYDKLEDMEHDERV